MKLTKYLLSVVSLFAISTSFAETYSTIENDTTVMKQVEKNKSSINIKDKGGNLFISGDVRSKWIAQSQVNKIGDTYYQNYNPTDSFEVKANLLFNYDANQSWAQTKLEFKSCELGTEGSSGALKLTRAFIGYDLIDQNEQELYLEIGRQGLDYLFESSIQFDSRFDGILVGYDYSWLNTGDFFIHGGPFIYNSKKSQFAYVVETGVTQLFETGLYTKLSYIDWNNHNYKNSPESRANLRYEITQIVLGYVFEPTTFGTPVRFYSGALCNTAARRNITSDYHKANKGYYAGVELGKLEVAGDYSIDINYQFVGLNAVPQFDCSGITSGYSENPYFAPTTKNQNDISPANMHAVTNYKGVSLTALYNLTSNLALRLDSAYSHSILNQVGGLNIYKKCELGLVYSY